MENKLLLSVLREIINRKFLTYSSDGTNQSLLVKFLSENWCSLSQSADKAVELLKYLKASLSYHLICFNNQIFRPKTIASVAVIKKVFSVDSS